MFNIMKIKILALLIFLAVMLPTAAISQNNEEDYFEDDDFYYSLPAKGELSVSLDFSLGTNKRKGEKKSTKASVDIKDYYTPYFSLSAGLSERIAMGVDLAYRISKINANVMRPLSNQPVTGDKTISGLDLITLWGSFGILKEHKMRPSIVLNSYFYLPNTGIQQFQTDNLGFFPEIAFHNTFTDEFDLYYSAGVTWDGTYNYPVYSLVLTPGYYLSDNFYAYAELWNSFDFRSSSQNYLTLAFSYIGSESYSLDLYGGSTFQKPGDNLFGGITFNYWFTAF